MSVCMARRVCLSAWPGEYVCLHGQESMSVHGQESMSVCMARRVCLSCDEECMSVCMTRRVSVCEDVGK